MRHNTIRDNEPRMNQIYEPSNKQKALIIIKTFTIVKI